MDSGPESSNMGRRFIYPCSIASIETCADTEAAPGPTSMIHAVAEATVAIINSVVSGGALTNLVDMDQAATDGAVASVLSKPTMSSTPETIMSATRTPHTREHISYTVGQYSIEGGVQEPCLDLLDCCGGNCGWRNIWICCVHCCHERVSRDRSNSLKYVN